MLSQILHCLSVLVFFIAPALAVLLPIRFLTKLPSFVFRKLLHFVAFTSVCLMILTAGSWQAAALTAVLIALALYPVLAALEGAPWYGERYSALVVEEGITRIGANAFHQQMLLSVSLPEGLESIGDYAFAASIQTIRLPASLCTLGDGVFSGCIYLETIEVAPGSETFTSAGGVLFDRDMTRLVCFPGQRSTSYVIPDGVREIAGGAFRIIQFQLLQIPASVEVIGPGAFPYYSGMLRIDYMGTREQWEAIDIAEDNPVLYTAQLRFIGEG